MQEIDKPIKHLCILSIDRPSIDLMENSSVAYENFIRILHYYEQSMKDCVFHDPNLGYIFRNIIQF